MEITSFYPLIPSDNIEATQTAYETIGFKQAHDISLLSDMPVRIIIMKK